MASTKKIFSSYTLFLTLSFFLTACSSSTEPGNESAEDKAIKELAETFGSVTSVSTGMYTGTESGSGKYYEVEITNSNLFTPDYDMQGVVGGTAYLLYKNFSEEERASYTRYDVIIKDTINQEVQFKVPATDAKLFYDQAAIATATMDKLLQGAFAWLNEQYIPERQCGPDSLKIRFDSLLVKTGQNRKVEIYQARRVEYEQKDGSKINAIGFQGAIVNDNPPVYFFILLDPMKKENYVIRIGYM